MGENRIEERPGPERGLVLCRWKKQFTPVAYSLRTVWFVIFAIVLVCKFSLPGYAADPAATPAPMFETDSEQLELLQARCDQRDQFILRFASALGILALFGAVCAIWAYRDCRSVFLWFTLGFSLNFLALLLILIVRRRNRGKKRYRRVITSWYVSR
jgi:peptidoglycan/LPS O-acetylase OafA/YrhL